MVEVSRLSIDKLWGRAQQSKTNPSRDLDIIKSDRLGLLTHRAQIIDSLRLLELDPIERLIRTEQASILQRATNGYRRRLERANTPETRRHAENIILAYYGVSFDSPKRDSVIATFVASDPAKPDQLQLRLITASEDLEQCKEALTLNREEAILAMNGGRKPRRAAARELGKVFDHHLLNDYRSLMKQSGGQGPATTELEAAIASPTLDVPIEPDF